MKQPEELKGKWIKTKNPNLVECSLCGHPTFLMDERDELDEICHSCLAKMDTKTVYIKD